VNFNPLRQRFLVASCAAVLILSGCHKKVVPPPPAPPPPPPPAPSGQSSTLSWSTANAAQVTISGLGTVTASGTRSVAPARSTDYTVTATGANGASVEATTRVTVTQPATPPPVAPAAEPMLTEDELFERSVHDVYFDYDKYALRPADQTIVEQDAAFLQSHPGMKILIEGHCDDRGSEEYNLALGENRAESLKKALISNGVDAGRIKVISDGSEKPFCKEETDACWQENRRDHLALDR
jgi:peptidoglycan-associated lipoprotein